MITIGFIYIIRCSESDMVYVGKTHNIEERWKQHKNERLVGNSKKCMYMCRFGLDKFKIECLEEVKYPEWIKYDKTEAKYILSDRETYWIGHYNSVKNGMNTHIQRRYTRSLPCEYTQTVFKKTDRTSIKHRGGGHSEYDKPLLKLMYNYENGVPVLASTTNASTQTD